MQGEKALKQPRFNRLSSQEILAPCHRKNVSLSRCVAVLLSCSIELSRIDYPLAMRSNVGSLCSRSLTPFLNDLGLIVTGTLGAPATLFQCVIRSAVMAGAIFSLNTSCRSVAYILQELSPYGSLSRV